MFKNFACQLTITMQNVYFLFLLEQDYKKRDILYKQGIRAVLKFSKGKLRLLLVNVSCISYIIIAIKMPMLTNLCICMSSRSLLPLKFLSYLAVIYLQNIYP